MSAYLANSHKPKAALKKTPSELSQTENQILGESLRRSSSPPEREGQQASPMPAAQSKNQNSKGNPRSSNCSPKSNDQQISPTSTDIPILKTRKEWQKTKSLTNLDSEETLFSPSIDSLPTDNGIDNIPLPHPKVTGAPGMAQDQQARPRPGPAATMAKLPVERDLIIKELFTFCIQAYKEVLPIIREVTETSDRIIWGEEWGRFRLWGNDYAVFEGELDQLLAGAEFKYLRISAVIPLCSIAKTLDACLSGLREFIPKAAEQDSTTSNDKAIDLNLELCTLLEVVLGLMPKAKGIIEPNTIDDNISELGLPDAAEDIKEALNSLFDLVPFIEELYVAVEEAPAEGRGRPRVLSVESAGDQTYFEAQFYEINIQDKFPEINEQLAKTLAKINWTRHRRIRELAKTNENQEQNERIKSNLTDSGLGNSLFNFEAPLSPTQKNPFSSNTSVTSFGTNNSTMSGGICVPKMPTPSSVGTIECCICFKVLSGINTKLLWKKHVLRDLQPYSCLFDSCSEKETTFGTRKAWVNHEFQHHRPQPEWRCSGSCVKIYNQKEDFEYHILEDHLQGTVTMLDIDAIVERCKFKRRETSCPFCAKIIPENRRSIQLHIGTHFDEIALKALPLGDEPEGNTPNRDDASIGNISQYSSLANTLSMHGDVHINSAGSQDSLDSDREALSELSTDDETERKEKEPRPRRAIVSCAVELETESEEEGVEEKLVEFKAMGARGNPPIPPRTSSWAPVFSFGKPASGSGITKSEEPSLTFPCELCNKRFLRTLDLNKHRKTHERLFKCSVKTCKYYLEGFPTSKERERHQNDIHALNSKEWKCEFPPCLYKSKRESNCKQHMEKAHGYMYKRMKRNPRRRDQGVQVITPTQRRRRNVQQVFMTPLEAPPSQLGTSIPPQEQSPFARPFDFIPQADIPNAETTDFRQPFLLDIAEGLPQSARGVHAELTNCSSDMDSPAAITKYEPSPAISRDIFGDYNTALRGHPNASPTLASEDFYSTQSTEQYMERFLSDPPSEGNSFGVTHQNSQLTISSFHYSGLDFTETLDSNREDDTPDNGSHRNHSS